MGGTDIIGRLFHSHGFVVDISRPYIANTLLAFQIVLRHALHGDGRVFKVLYLSLVSIPDFKSGVELNEDQYGSHDDHVDNYDKSLLHAQVSLEKPSHDRRCSNTRTERKESTIINLMITR